jgi:hypothetical protein
MTVRAVASWLQLAAAADLQAKAGGGADLVQAHLAREKAVRDAACVAVVGLSSPRWKRARVELSAFSEGAAGAGQVVEVLGDGSILPQPQHALPPGAGDAPDVESWRESTSPCGRAASSALLAGTGPLKRVGARPSEPAKLGKQSAGAAPGQPRERHKVVAVAVSVRPALGAFGAALAVPAAVSVAFR